MEISKDSLGTLTGDLDFVWYKLGADFKIETFESFVQDANRIKDAFRKDLLPNREGSKTYWEQTQLLKGDGFIASRIAL